MTSTRVQTTKIACHLHGDFYLSTLSLVVAKNHHARLPADRNLHFQSTDCFIAFPTT